MAVSGIPYMLWAIPAFHYFGSFTSNSIAAKHAQAACIGVSYLGGKLARFGGEFWVRHQDA